MWKKIRSLKKIEGTKNAKVKKNFRLNFILKIICALLNVTLRDLILKKIDQKQLVQNMCFVLPQTALNTLMIPRFIKVKHKYEAKLTIFRNIKTITKIDLKVQHGKRSLRKSYFEIRIPTFRSVK